MKKMLVLALCTFITWQASAQTSSKSDVKMVRIRNAGSIIQNGIVKGYYSFYDLEKKDRKNNNYSLSVSDENLREISSVTITRPNTYFLIDAAFNGSSFAFLFFDHSSKSLELIAYDQTLKEQGKVVKELKNKFASASYMYVAQGHEPLQAFLVAVPNKGFVYYGIKEDSKSDFEIEFFDNSLKRSWVTYAPKDEFDFENATEAYQGDQYVGSIIMKRTAMLDLNPDLDLMVQNIADGKTLFRIPLESSKYKLALADLTFDETKQQFILFGEYFDKDDNVLKDESLGFITVVLDMKGKIVSEKVNRWKEDIAAKVDAKDKDKFESTSILFHEFVRTSDGDFFAIGEQYKKGGTPMSMKLNVYNMIFFQFDANFTLKKVHVFEKDKNSFSLGQGFVVGGSKMLSYIAKGYGGFDYIFTQVPPDKNTFIVSYINYDREKGQKAKNQLGSIVYTPEKTFTVDKLDLARKSSKYFVYRAKPGYVMISEYFEKEKRIENRLEKINY